MVPIIHRECGTQIGWYLRDEPRNPDYGLSEDVVWMDGTHPPLGSTGVGYCPLCKTHSGGIKRVFPDIAPKSEQEEK